MARTVRQRVALGVTIAFATVRWQRSIRFEGAWPGRAWSGAQRQEALREGDVRRQRAVRARPATASDTGTLGLADVQRIIDKADPDDRFLIHDALDDDGVGTTRVQTHATIALSIPLPPWVSLADEPGATHVTVFRGIPSTMNTPALDPILNHDGRPPTVQEQALGAIHDHYQNTVEPTAAELDAIAQFQRTDEHFFSSNELRRFAAGGPPPELPPGNTPAEKRGRTFLVDAPFDPPSKNGICALCHSGPMLNTVNQAHSDFGGGRPRPGVRFFGTGVTIVNAPNNPIRTWIINDGVNPVVTIQSPDLGLLLHPTLILDPSHPPVPPPFAVPRAFFAKQFKNPDALGRQGHRALLPRQRREDAPRRRRSLSAVLQLHGGGGPGWFGDPGRAHHADRRRR